ncbi:MAG: hypothetical protein IV100_17130 [Myxococcales bacterium]|nr:hypothetical protein [Myxococcales bacterium]
MKQHWLKVLSLVIPLNACSSDESSPAPATDTSTDGSVDGDSSGSDSTDSDATGSDGDTVDGSDGDTTDGGDTTIEPTAPSFHFGTDPGQNLSEAPFPNDLYLEADGTVGLASLATDPVLSTLANPTILATWDAQLGVRKGFGSGMPIWFFQATGNAPDLATFADKIEIVVLDGPEKGRTVKPQVFWSAPAKALGVFPAWGDYLMAESTVAVVVRSGGKTDGGDAFAADPGLVRTLSETDPGGDGDVTAARAAFAPLRAWMTDNTVPAGDVIAATVFTTEPVLDVAQAVLKGVDDFTLEAPSARVRLDATADAWVDGGLIEGEDLASYFGSPVAPHELNPGMWDGNRERAGALAGDNKAYTGGTFTGRIDRVVNGSFVIPSFNSRVDGTTILNEPLKIEGGKAVATAETVVPFTLYLCSGTESTLGNMPVALVQHGGGAIRADATPFATANCQTGVATIVIDMIYHGGRRKQAVKDGQIAPTEADIVNVYTGKTEGDPDYSPDFVGDPGSAAASVGQLYALSASLQPNLIEANTLSIVADNYAVLRYLKEGDWTGLVPGLAFDDARIFHESLSFGTSYSTALLALADDFKGIVGSVGSSYILNVNMPMGPANAFQAGSIIKYALGLVTTEQELQANSLVDLPIGILAWLAERGDSHSFAPYILRHRPSDGPLPAVVHSGNTWDETLFNMAQLTFANAIGLPTFTAGEPWTIGSDVPGADLLAATAWTNAISNNVTFGGKTTTAGIFWQHHACHAQVLTALCAQRFEHPYPPLKLLSKELPEASPICGLHSQIGTFLSSLLEGDVGLIVSPTATCNETYGK